MQPRAYHPDDLEALVALVNEAALGGEAELEPVSRAALVEAIGAPTIDLARDLRVWCDRDRAIVGFGRRGWPRSASRRTGSS